MVQECEITLRVWVLGAEDVPARNVVKVEKDDECISSENHRGSAPGKITVYNAEDEEIGSKDCDSVMGSTAGEPGFIDVPYTPGETPAKVKWEVTATCEECEATAEADDERVVT